VSGRASHLRPRDARDRLIVALDAPSAPEAKAMVARLGDSVAFYKVGLELAFAGGLDLVPRLVGAGKRVFLDVKLLDIANTVAGAVRSIARTGATLATVHAYPQAMRAATAARGDAPLGLLGVTVLTSMDDADLHQAGYAAGTADLVATRAAAAIAAGMDGLVCSPHEAARLRALVGPDMLLVTPGIRPQGSEAGDQKRIAAPADAIRAGADYLVVGRPVTGADDPKGAAERIVAEIAAALA
jgi:orotidine-5'-phosphate decarboxylase